MRALVLRKPGQADLETIPDPVLTDSNVLLRVRMVGFCGSDLNSFRGLNPLVTYPRILGHEVSATVVEECSKSADGDLQRVDRITLLWNVRDRAYVLRGERDTAPSVQGWGLAAALTSAIEIANSIR